MSMSSRDASGNVGEQVRGIVAHIMGVPAIAISDDTSARSLQSWDSLRHMKLILAVEEKFDVRLTDEQIVSITDVRSIVSLVGRNRGADA